jgi:N,N'-diacetyllegionaminate synthase
MRQVKIGNRVIGENQSPFIVAEAGINHNGDLKIAFEMIAAAKISGADAVKFQTFKASEFISDPNQTFTYKSQGKQVTESMLTMFSRVEFNSNQWAAIKKKCDEEGILFLSTPQNPSDLKILLQLGIPAIKVGSDDFTNLPLLKNYAQSKLPMIISCGMSDMSDVHQALDAVGALDGYPTILLLCTSQYPTPPKDVNILKIKTLTKAFSSVPIGFSDHTQGATASTLAVALGACFFEKHFTLDQNLPGPDHWFSENPQTLKVWVDAIRTSHTMLGNSLVRATAAEKEMRILARRSIVLLKDIVEGETLSEEAIGLRRPGNGLPPSLYEKVVGLRASKNLKKNALLQLGDFK